MLCWFPIVAKWFSFIYIHLYICMYIYIYTFFCRFFKISVFVSFKQIWRNGIVGSYGSSISWGASILFSIEAAPIYIPTNSVGGLLLLQSHQCLLFHVLFVTTVLTGVRLGISLWDWFVFLSWLVMWSIFSGTCWPSLSWVLVFLTWLSQCPYGIDICYPPRETEHLWESSGSHLCVCVCVCVWSDWWETERQSVWKKINGKEEIALIFGKFVWNPHIENQPYWVF